MIIKKKCIPALITAWTLLFSCIQTYAYTAADLLDAAAKGEQEKVVKIIKMQAIVATAKKPVKGQSEIISIDCRNDDERTPLMLASYWGRTNVVKTLISSKADINAIDADGKSPLFFAVEGKRNDVSKYLIEHKAAVNIKDKYGQTILMRAIQCDNIEIIESLLNAGSDINAQNNEGYTPLSLAVQKKQYNVIDMLIKKKADVNKKDKKNKIAMDYAGNNTKLIRLLSADYAQ